MERDWKALRSSILCESPETRTRVGTREPGRRSSKTNPHIESNNSPRSTTGDSVLLAEDISSNLSLLSNMERGKQPERKDEEMKDSEREEELQAKT